MTCDLRGALSYGPEFFEQCYVFRIPTHRRCYTPTANYRLVDTRIARSINPGVALTGLQPAANLVGGTPDVNRDTKSNCPTMAMNASDFGRANQSDHMSSSSNTSIAKKAHTKAEADFATWLMMAKLGGFDDLPSNAQNFLTNYQTRLETMSEAESTPWPFARSTALITARWEAWARPRSQRRPSPQRQWDKSRGSRGGLNLSPVYRLHAIRRGQ